MRFPYSPRTTRPSVESPESRPGSATWGRPLCRKVRLTMRTCRAISKHPIHRQFRMFSRPCCTNGTQLRLALELVLCAPRSRDNPLNIKDKLTTSTWHKLINKSIERTVFERGTLAGTHKRSAGSTIFSVAWLEKNQNQLSPCRK